MPGYAELILTKEATLDLQRMLYPHLQKPFGAFCHAVRANGFLFMSGFTAGNTPAQNGDIVAQTEAVMDQIQGILEAEGAGLEHVKRR